MRIINKLTQILSQPLGTLLESFVFSNSTSIFTSLLETLSDLPRLRFSHPLKLLLMMPAGYILNPETLGFMQRTLFFTFHVIVILSEVKQQQRYLPLGLIWSCVQRGINQVGNPEEKPRVPSRSATWHVRHGREYFVGRYTKASAMAKGSQDDAQVIDKRKNSAREASEYSF